MKRRLNFLLALLLSLSILLCSCEVKPSGNEPTPPPIHELDSIPAFDGVTPYVEIHGNEPYFSKEEKSVTESFESYSELDALGRCGVTYACIGRDIMPTEEREPLTVTPSGWVQKQYDGDYLYNRCHLIGFQLTGENNNKCNLVTGTVFLNLKGMLPFENMVADYVKETGNHVIYRVTPIYEGEYDLVPAGVLMEGWSVEDEGEGICFNVYCYNVQPGVIINYFDGSSRAEGDTSDDSTLPVVTIYILNTNGKTIHLPSCYHAQSIKEENKQEFSGDIQTKTDEGYKACGTCKPLG